MKRLILVPLAVAMVACGGGAEPEAPAPRAAAETDTAAAALAAGRRVASIEFEPARVELQRGDSAILRGRLLDAQGNAVQCARWRVRYPSGTELRSIKDEIPDA